MSLREESGRCRGWEANYFIMEVRELGKERHGMRSRTQKLSSAKSALTRRHMSHELTRCHPHSSKFGEPPPLYQTRVPPSLFPKVNKLKGVALMGPVWLNSFSVTSNHSSSKLHVASRNPMRLTNKHFVSTFILNFNT